MDLRQWFSKWGLPWGHSVGRRKLERWKVPCQKLLLLGGHGVRIPWFKQPPGSTTTYSSGPRLPVHQPPLWSPQTAAADFFPLLFWNPKCNRIYITPCPRSHCTYIQVVAAFRLHLAATCSCCEHKLELRFVFEANCIRCLDQLRIEIQFSSFRLWFFVFTYLFWIHDRGHVLFHSTSINKMHM